MARAFCIFIFILSYSLLTAQPATTAKSDTVRPVGSKPPVSDSLETELLNDDMIRFVPDTTSQYSGFYATGSYPHFMTENPIRYLSQIYDQRESITGLDLQFFYGHTIPDSLRFFPNLRELTLSCHRSGAWPPNLDKLQKLEKLFLHYDNGVLPPHEIGQLSNLTTLSLYTGSYELPEEFSHLQTLKHLTITCACTRASLNKIFSLKNLETLELRCTEKIDAIPPDIGNLTALRVLTLSDNKITSLPPLMGLLENLETLNLSKNQLSTLPGEMLRLKKLKTFDLSDNLLESLPAQLGELENLVSLNVESNHLTSLPDEIGRLTLLENLIVRYNRLSTFPTGIGNLKSLTRLDAYHNPIQHIPDEIAKLSNDAILIIDRSHISHCSEKAWQILNHSGFKIPEVPRSIAGKPVAYYLARNDIDKWSKRYVQGKLALQNDSATQQIADSIVTHNKETQLFYLHLLVSVLDTSRDNGVQMDYTNCDPFYRSISKTIIYNPCMFLEQVKYGRYKAYCERWLFSAAYSLPGSENETEDETKARIKKEVKKNLINTCGAQYNKELDELIRWLTRYVGK